MKDYEKLNDFLDQTPLAEKPEECRVLFKLVHPEANINVEISQVSFMIKKDFGAALFPWQLFLLVHLDKHEMALDFLEENIQRRTGQIINFMNIPLLKPLHQYQRFQDLLQSTFRTELLPSDAIYQLRSTSSKALISDVEIVMVLKNLEKGMVEEKWFLDASLTLRKLAEYLKVSSNKLSWLLNEQLNQNFNEYINRFRLENFKEIALNPANKHYTLLAIANKSGFNSKTVFNAFFKKIEGVTPKAWFKSNQV